MSLEGYKLRVSGGLVSVITDVGLPTLVGSRRSYTLTGLTADTPYEVEVAAYNEVPNQSDWSDPEAARTDATPPTPTNVALASAGSTATNSSTVDPTNFGPERCIDGYRNTNNNWNSAATPGGGWASANNPSIGSPEWLQIDFGVTRNISEVDVITVADALNYTTDPTLTDTFTSQGVVDYKVQSSPDAVTWTDRVTVTANDKVWRQHTGLSFSARYMRVLVTSALGGFAVLVEVEAWGN